MKFASFVSFILLLTVGPAGAGAEELPETHLRVAVTGPSPQPCGPYYGSCNGQYGNRYCVGQKCVYRRPYRSKPTPYDWVRPTPPPMTSRPSTASPTPQMKSPNGRCGPKYGRCNGTGPDGKSSNFYCWESLERCTQNMPRNPYPTYTWDARPEDMPPRTPPPTRSAKPARNCGAADLDERRLKVCNPSLNVDIL